MPSWWDCPRWEASVVVGCVASCGFASLRHPDNELSGPTRKVAARAVVAVARRATGAAVCGRGVWVRTCREPRARRTRATAEAGLDAVVVGLSAMGGERCRGMRRFLWLRFAAPPGQRVVRASQKRFAARAVVAVACCGDGDGG